MTRSRPFLYCSGLLLLVLMIGSVPPAAAVPADEDLLHGLEFREIGPFRGGRSTTVTGHPDLPFTFFMGTSGGGVWKTTNAGTTWKNISDGFFSSASIGAVEVAPSDLNVMFVGTGSGCPRGNIMNGDGIYRSLDAGATWKHVGLEAAGLIPRMVIHPKKPDVVFAAVLGDIFEPNEERGVYRSTDGGESWERVLFVSERTGAVDVAMDPSNPRVLYAAMWTAERKPWTLVDGSDEGGLWKSVDGGDTWNKLSNGLPEGAVGRIGLAISPAKPNRIWAHFTAPHGEGGVFRSEDSGASWNLVNGERKLQVRGWYYSHLEAHPTDPDTVFSIGLRFYKSIDGGKNFEPISTPHGDNHDLWVHPKDPLVMVEANDGGGTVTLDGGATWSTLHNQPTAELYRLTVDQGFPYRLYAAQQDNSSISVPAWGEGGFSQEQDWWMAGGGESGHIAVHPDRPNVIFSGNYIGLLEKWDRTTGERKGIMLYPELADGVPPRELAYRFQWNAPIRLSPHDAGVLYQTSHQVHRSLDDGESWETLTGDLSYDDEEKQALPGGPIQFDDTGVEVYSTVFAFEESSLRQGELWAGTDDGRIHLSRDNGQTWSEITPQAMEEDTTVNTIELSTVEPGRAYIAAHRYRLGDDQPLIFRTDDYGASWRLISEDNGIADGHFVRVVREHPQRPEFLVAGTELGLYASFDGGDQWQTLQLNLPVVQVADAAFVSGGLALATHGRSFWVLDDVTPLLEFSDDVRQSEVHLFEPSTAYRLGRSGGYSMGTQPDRKPSGANIFVWLAEDEAGQQTSAADTSEDGSGAKRSRRRNRSDIRKANKSDGAAGNTAQKNADDEGEDTPRRDGTLSIRDADGNVVRTSAVVVGGELDADDKSDGFVLRPGLNQLRWNFSGERPETLKGSVMSLGYTGPNQLPPGDYRVVLALDSVESTSGGSAVQEFEQTVSLRVEPDPRLEGDGEGARAAYQLAEEAKMRVVAIHDTVGALRSVRSQLGQLRERLDDKVEAEDGSAGERWSDIQSDVDERSEDLLEKMAALEEQLIQTKAEASQDGLNFPPKLDNQYSFLYGQLVGMGSKPNDGAYRRLRDLDARWRPLEQQWQELVSGPLRELNKVLDEGGVDVLMTP